MTKTRKSVRVPADVKAAISASAAAMAKWDNLAPSHKAEYLKWIGEAKKPETRARRISQTVEKLIAAASAA